jgi:hypothetical protein
MQHGGTEHGGTEHGQPEVARWMLALELTAQ